MQTPLETRTPLRLLQLLLATFVTGNVLFTGTSNAADDGGEAAVVNVGVIGGGIGGSAAAYFLRGLWRGENGTLNISFVTDDTTGRTTSVNVGGQGFEEGGSVIHPKNVYMRGFVESAAHSSELAGGEGNGFSGIVDDAGEFFFFSTNHKLADDVRMAERYGLSVLRIEHLVDSMLKRFERIYNLQADGRAFSTVAAMLLAMDESGDFLNMTRTSGAAYLRDRGISDVAIHELVATATRVNYNQDPANITAFPTLVALAGSQSGLFAVKGGNCRVAEGLKVQAGANRATGSHVTRVERVTKGANGAAAARPSYVVTTDDGATSVFDALAVAVPLQLADIEFVNFPTPPAVPSCCPAYQTVYATLVKGRPRAAYVSLPVNMSGANYPDLVATLPGTSMQFTCIGRESTVGGEPVSGAPVWKLFSHGELTNATLNEVFESIEYVYDKQPAFVSHRWQAYPEYRSGPEEFTPFLLDDAVAYTSTIEWAASAMEMSAIAGRNAALLLSQALQP